MVGGTKAVVLKSETMDNVTDGMQRKQRKQETG
jgi:hypothetical protein